LFFFSFFFSLSSSALPVIARSLEDCVIQQRRTAFCDSVPLTTTVSHLIQLLTAGSPQQGGSATAQQVGAVIGQEPAKAAL